MSSHEHSMNRVFTYLVRHGVTGWNAERRIQGQMDIPLSGLGKQQAKAVATWIAQQPVQFTTLYTSDLRRARQTAQAIGETLGLDPIPCSALRESRCGDWEGLTGEDIDALYPGERERWRADRARFVMPGGESLIDVQARMNAFYQDAVRRHEDESIIIVGHGAALLCLLAALEGWNLDEVWQYDSRRLANTGVTILSRFDGNHRVEIHDSHDHLPE